MQRLKKFNRNENGNLKKKILIGIYVFLIIGIILTGASYAVYQTDTDVLFINARVGNFKQNDIELAIKLDGEEVEVPPEKNSIYTVTVDCDNGAGEWDKTKWAAVIGNITSGKVKCEVNFNTPVPTLSDVTATPEKTSINLSYTASGININTTCKWSREEVQEGEEYPNIVEEVTNNNCNIDNLEMDTTYYYQVCTSNGGGEVCRNGNIKTKPYSIGGTEILKVGDYIEMIPTSTSYKISKDLTGYTNDQTINPSELNIWRVLKINSDGSVEIVSQKSSSEYVYFQGETGFRYYIKTLNNISNSYSNNNYTLSGKSFGYEGQQEVWTGSDPLSDIGNGNFLPGEQKTSIIAMGVDNIGTLKDTWYPGRYTTEFPLSLMVSGQTSSDYCFGSKIYAKYMVWVDKSIGYVDRCGRRESGNEYSVMVTALDAGKWSGSFDRVNGPDLLNSAVSGRIRPVLTLRNTIIIVDGDGSESNVYKLL